jgi:uncharacterized cupin superfamily protein
VPKPVRRVVTGHCSDGEVLLRAGDVVVQQGTNHAWINRGSVTCRLAMEFIDAEEPSCLK